MFYTERERGGKVSDMKQRYVFTFLAVIWMFLIFILFAQTADESSTLSGSICYELCRIFVSDFESMNSVQQMAMTESMQDVIRSASHFVEYGILGFLLSFTFKSFSVKRFALNAVLLGTVYAASDGYMLELH